MAAYTKGWVDLWGWKAMEVIKAEHTSTVIKKVLSNGFMLACLYS